VLSIIIVTFNCQNYILDCLSSVLKVNIGQNIFVVDNGSFDETPDIINKKFLEVRLIKNKVNLGFAAAANQGAEIANGKYLLFLNPDTVVKPDSIDQMLRVVKSNNKIGIAGCKILNSEGLLQPSCGNFPTIANIILDRIPSVNKILKTELIRKKNYYDYGQTPDWISGAFFLVRKDIFTKLGGFDEDYFMYIEDVDFCFRAKQAGYKVYYNSDASIVHYDMGKFGQRKIFKARNMRRGFSLFFKKYKPFWYVFIWQATLAIEKLFKLRL
jgi:O-antigen biosynthesis protein